MRQYGEVPPWLAAENTPAVSSVSGLGTGGSAAVQTPDSGGFGNVNVWIGTNPNTSWNIVLAFPSTPPTLFVAGDDAFGPMTQVTSGNNVTLSGNAAKFIRTGQPLTIHYEWSVSK